MESMCSLPSLAAVRSECPIWHLLRDKQFAADTESETGWTPQPIWSSDEEIPSNPSWTAPVASYEIWSEFILSRTIIMG